LKLFKFIKESLLIIFFIFIGFLLLLLSVFDVLFDINKQEKLLSGFYEIAGSLEKTVCLICNFDLIIDKKMIDLSLKMGMAEYALDGLEILRGILPGETYSPYREEILARIREKQQRTGF